MSRTTRNRYDSKKYYIEEVEDAIKLKNHIESNEIICINNKNLFYFYLNFLTITKLSKSNDQEKKAILLEIAEKNLFEAKRKLAMYNVDKGNWTGKVSTLTKAYCNKKRRSGKRKLCNTIIQNLDVKDVDKIEDRLYFMDENLGSIRGARWNFD